LEAHLPTHIRNEDRNMSDAKAFEELDLAMLLDDMKASYLGPSEGELAQLVTSWRN